MSGDVTPKGDAPSTIDVSVILPFYRQADQVEPVVQPMIDALRAAGISFELLLVPNGPDDGTRAACARMADGDARVRCVDFLGSGWGAAVRRGIAASTGTHLCYSNSARTRPGDLVAIVRYGLRLDGVLVRASRRSRDSWHRRLGSLLYNLECRALFDLADYDVNGTPKMFPRSFERLLALESDGDLLDAEVCAVSRRAGYPVLEVPVVEQHRASGRSTTNLRSALRMYRGAIGLRRRLDGAS